MKYLDVLKQSVLEFLGGVGYPVVVLDESVTIVWVNRALAERFAAPADQIVGRGAGETLSAANRSAFLGWVAEWRGGDVTPRRVTLAMRDGQPAAMWLLPQPLRDEAGRYVGCILGLLDEAVFGLAVRQAFRDAGGLLEEVLAGLARDGARAEASRAPQLDLLDLRGSVPELAALTDREWAVACRIGRGDRSSSIARDLEISASTVRNHLKAVYRKTGIHSQAELIDRFRGWLREPQEPT